MVILLLLARERRFCSKTSLPANPAAVQSVQFAEQQAMHWLAINRSSNRSTAAKLIWCPSVSQADIADAIGNVCDRRPPIKTKPAVQAHTLKLRPAILSSP